MVEMVRTLSPFSADQFLLTILMGIVFFVGVPLVVSFVVKDRRRKMRKRGTASPRRIALATDEIAPRTCEHARSKSRAREMADGRLTSICKKCGVTMVRNAPGDWVVDP